MSCVQITFYIRPNLWRGWTQRVELSIDKKKINFLKQNYSVKIFIFWYDNEALNRTKLESYALGSKSMYCTLCSAKVHSHSSSVRYDKAMNAESAVQIQIQTQQKKSIQHIDFVIKRFDMINISNRKLICKRSLLNYRL